MRKIPPSILITILILTLFFSCESSDQSTDTEKKENSFLNTYYSENPIKYSVYKHNLKIYESHNTLDTSFAKKMDKLGFSYTQISLFDYSVFFKQHIQNTNDFKKYVFELLPQENEILTDYANAYMHEVLFDGKKIPISEDIKKYLNFDLIIRQDGGYALYDLQELDKLAASTPENYDDSLVSAMKIIFGNYLFDRPRLVLRSGYKKISLLGNGDYLKIFKLFNIIRHNDTSFYNETEILIKKYILPSMTNTYKYNKKNVLSELDEIIKIAEDSSFFSYELLDSLKAKRQKIVNNKAKFECNYDNF